MEPMDTATIILHRPGVTYFDSDWAIDLDFHIDQVDQAQAVALVRAAWDADSGRGLFETADRFGTVRQFADIGGAVEAVNELYDSARIETLTRLEARIGR